MEAEDGWNLGEEVVSRKNGAEHRRRIRMREAAFDRQGGLCWWCKQPMARGPGHDGNPRKLTGDHLYRVREGGTTVVCNIVAACLACNHKRN